MTRIKNIISNQYHQLNLAERGRIESLRDLDWSIRRIAQALHRNPSTISRELKRGTTTQINASTHIFEQSYLAETGWQWYNGNWYFMDQQNAWMMTGWATNTTNDQLYYLDQNGHPVTGWQRDSHGFWYYLQPSDAAAIGWNWINGYWYYFNPEETINGIKAKGAMFIGRHFIDNRWNRFDLNGHWLGYEN